MYLAIDIGGSKTLLATFSTSGKLHDSVKFKTPHDYPEFLKEIAKAFEKLNPDGKLTACAVGAPGRIDRPRGIAVVFGNLPWTNVPLVRDMQKITNLPTSLDNDANLAGLSEAILIKHNYKKALYVTVSTGIGGIVIVNGMLKEEYADMEPGLMKFEHDGKIQQWEDFASGHHIYETYGKKASELEDPELWRVISRNIGLGLTNVIVNHTPDVVIIGGGVGAHFDKFADPLHEILMLYSTPSVPLPPIRQAIRAEEAVIYGCYELARQNHR